MMSAGSPCDFARGSWSNSADRVQPQPLASADELYAHGDGEDGILPQPEGALWPLHRKTVGEHGDDQPNRGIVYVIHIHSGTHVPNLTHSESLFGHAKTLGPPGSLHTESICLRRRRSRARCYIEAMQRLTPGMKAFSIDGQRVGEVRLTNACCFVVGTPSQMLFLIPESIFHVGDGRLTLMCSPAGTARYVCAVHGQQAPDSPRRIAS